MLKEKGKDNSRIPRWINVLQPVIAGSYTADNLDYVLRDAYMCGVAVGPVDLTRLIHYTIITDKGFTIHKTGLPALHMFLNTRMYLYSNVYYHRTTRAIDIHLRDIFGDTMKRLFPANPATHMEEYLTLTDWSLLEDVRRWKKAANSTLRRLHEEWAHILGRDVKWKMAYSTVLKEKGVERGMDFPSHIHFQQQIQSALPPNCAPSRSALIWRRSTLAPTPRTRAGPLCSSTIPGPRGCRPSPWKNCWIYCRPGSCNSVFMRWTTSTMPPYRQPQPPF
ncbi:MAG: hypothetical protein MRJ92_12405 [Nitrospira sp.]|nr:hypothetical protein [Nitrospira sp.]